MTDVYMYVLGLENVFIRFPAATRRTFFKNLSCIQNLMNVCKNFEDKFISKNLILINFKTWLDLLEGQLCTVLELQSGATKN